MQVKQLFVMEEKRNDNAYSFSISTPSGSNLSYGEIMEVIFKMANDVAQEAAQRAAVAHQQAVEQQAAQAAAAPADQPAN
jgi:hypothetical protein